MVGGNHSRLALLRLYGKLFMAMGWIPAFAGMTGKHAGWKPNYRPHQRKTGVGFEDRAGVKFILFE
jgi:hypothetical protein